MPNSAFIIPLNYKFMRYRKKYLTGATLKRLKLMYLPMRVRFNKLILISLNKYFLFYFLVIFLSFQIIVVIPLTFQWFVGTKTIVKVEIYITFFERSFDLACLHQANLPSLDKELWAAAFFLLKENQGSSWDISWVFFCWPSSDLRCLNERAESYFLSKGNRALCASNRNQRRVWL